MQLKKYQTECLNKLHEYATECRKHPPEDGAAFAWMKFQPEKGYHRFSPENNAPIVCLKVPTGGGKTLIASHSVSVLFETFLKERASRGLVMWFVPSDSIRTQTLKALKNRNHAFRKSLDSNFDNKVRVFDITEAKQIRKGDLSENVCIVISTLGAFRREARDTLKVFQNNGALLEHFEELPEEAKEFLEKDKNKEIINSLANVIRLHNPLTIVDEGHNIDTELSLQMLEVLNPSFVLEFTATPRKSSNVLVEIGAQALKEQKMIKMPILLHPVSPWQEAIYAGIKKRKELETISDKNQTGYIRPIMLIQAEQEKESEKRVFVEQIKKFLVNDAKISEDEIVVKTATKNNLPDAETLADDKCPIRYIITVNALREGWDCPFAYILVSVSNLGAAVSVEQTIGRIMRLPYVKEHKSKELNQAYIFASTSNFTQTAENVISALKKNGYEDISIVGGGVNVEPKTYKKLVKEKIAISYINIKDESGKVRKIDYVADLISEQKLLQGLSTEIGFELPKENNEIVRIDVRHGGQLVKEKGGNYAIMYHADINTKEGLLSWLRFRVHREYIAMKEISDFLNRLFASLLQRYPVEKLGPACYSLKDVVERVIDSAVNKATQKRFGELEKRGLLQTDGEGFEFGDEMTLTATSKEPFERHAYEKVADINREELQFAKKVDALPNVKWWLRNPENGGFGIQGWKKDKFRPDFLLKTKNNDLIVIEYKGAHLATGEDTDYKRALGEKWAKLSGGKHHFFLAEKNNTDKIVSGISEL
ncbi:MAG: DEAD/DEAH box helicase family protein [bacterium]|nr:DEAD/DEAH box helicase family protein [bacterium]